MILVLENHEIVLLQLMRVTSTDEAPEKEEPARFNSKQMDFVNMTVSGFICQIPSKKQLEKLT